MKVTKQARRDAKQLFRSCLVDGLLDESRARRVVTEVIAKKPRGFLAILSHFQRLVKLDQDRRTALVESAAPLAPEIQTEVAGQLAWIYGPGLNLSFAQDPTLIGGM